MGLFGTDIGPDIKLNPGNVLGAAGGFYSGAGGLLGGLFGGKLFDEVKGITDGGQPFNAPPPSKELLENLGQYQQGQIKSPEELRQRYLEGVGEAGNALGFDPMSQALSGRARRAFDRSKGDIERQATLQAATGAVDRAGKAVDSQQQFLNFRRNIASRADQFQAQADATRNQIIGSLFGSAGGAIGSYAGLSQGKGSVPLGGNTSSNIYSGSNSAINWNPSAPPIGTAFA